jgi:hypothetical protein
LHLVPKKWKRETSLSAKAAYFMDLAPGMILFSDDKDPDSDFEEVVKRATTNFQKETVHTTVKDLAMKSVIIPPRSGSIMITPRPFEAAYSKPSVPALFFSSRKLYWI